MPDGSRAPDLPNEDISGFGWSDFRNSLLNRRWTVLLAMALASDAFGELVKSLRADYGYVVFDSPPISKVPEGLALARAVDVTILVVRARRSSRRLTRLVLTRLAETGASCRIGMVLNGSGRSPAGAVAPAGAPAGRTAASSRF